MAKTIDHLDLYVAIAEYEHKSVPGQTFNCLRVYVSYRKGRGFIVGFHPGWGDDSMWGCMMGIGDTDPLTAGIEVLAIAATKNCVKTLQAIYDNLNAGTARKIIAYLFDTNRWEALRVSLKHIATNSSWATEELLQSLMKGGSDNKENINNQNETTMNENVKAADLIGKVIKINGTDKYYKVLGVDGDKLLTEFHIGEGKEPMSVPLPMANLKGFLEKNVWSIEGEAAAQTGPAAATADDDVQEVEDVQPAKPTAKPKQEKAKAEPKAKTKTESKAKMQDNGQSSMVNGQCSKLTYETYTSSKGKACARILGFKEDDAAYKNAADIHGSASWNTTKDGRVLYVAFGHKYVEKAKQVCDALNQGKSLDDCKAIIEGKTAAPQGDKTYTLDEVAAKLKKLLPDGDKATIEDIKKLLEAA